jgi:hypothetical protein
MKKIEPHYDTGIEAHTSKNMIKPGASLMETDY